ncbi:16S rRNA (cytosine(1402)-N(4))-methyltransferase RsmH [Candidatus Gracilibacteria bacterium]|nr:16S rRNA (cytosine(1402)-N(4))-methyltransferase RsmH [Candidatus Gracilibacteria bacterium]
MITFCEQAKKRLLNVQNLPMTVATKLFHDPVLKNEVLEELVTPATSVFFDGTLGLGGHAEAVLEKYGRIEKYVATDLDKQHLEFARNRLKKFDKKLALHLGNFSEFSTIFPQERLQEGTASVLLDLGLCSNQIDDPEKGFSFMADGPLKMAFDGSERAEELLNTVSEKDLTRVFRDFGELKRAPILARKIIEARKEKPLKTTGELRSIIETHTHPLERKKTLTQVFQAIRIEANQELEHLQKFLNEALEILQKGDRLGIMSYHSLEDRYVKNTFTKATKPETAETQFSLHTVVAPAPFELITRKPITPTKEEIARNPRSRSVKFRIIEKI